MRQVLLFAGYWRRKTRTVSFRIGASYHRGQAEAAFSAEDQQQNRQRLIDCFPQAEWTREVGV